DGLRAICVLAVILFHAFPIVIPGGFLGVDVFFVISGYLMTILITSGLQEGTFTFREFFSRRVKRIFPALFVTLVMSLAIGWTTFYPDEFAGLLDQISAGALFFANWHFLFRLSDYFSDQMIFYPLLHLWSLAVEEQFYLFAPLLFWITFRRKWNLRVVFISVIVASAAFYFILVQKNEIQAFYGTVPRLWEFFAGGLLAQLNFPHRKNLLGSIGGAVLAIIFLFPLALAKFVAVPFTVVSTALIIGSGKDSLINRKLFSHPFLVEVGKSSFSIYLWHWPLLSFTRILSAYELGEMTRLSIVLASIVVGILSRKFIEDPFRKGRLAWPWALAMIALGGFCFRYYGDFSVTGRITNTNFSPVSVKSVDCADKPELQAIGEIVCREVSQKKIDAVLWGDSHANDKFHGLSVKDQKRGWRIIGKGCPPSLDYHEKDETLCPEATKKVLEWIISDQDIRIVVLAFRGEYPETGLSEGLEKTIQNLLNSGKEVVLLIDIPRFPYRVKDCERRPGPCEVPESKVWTGAGQHRNMIQALIKKFPALRVFDPLPLFCHRGICTYKNGETILYRDWHHLTRNGSEFYADRFLEQMKL
ncbi:MAG: acyltransferase family protein, partial [Bacteriovoracaceae bacterium]